MEVSSNKMGIVCPYTGSVLSVQRRCLGKTLKRVGAMHGDGNLKFEVTLQDWLGTCHRRGDRTIEGTIKQSLVWPLVHEESMIDVERLGWRRRPEQPPLHHPHSFQRGR